MAEEGDKKNRPPVLRGKNVHVNLTALENFSKANGLTDPKELAKEIARMDETGSFSIEVAAIDRIQRTGQTSSKTLAFMAKALKVPVHFLEARLVPDVKYGELLAYKAGLPWPLPPDVDLISDPVQLNAVVAAWEDAVRVSGGKSPPPAGVLGFPSGKWLADDDSDECLGWFEVINRASSLGKSSKISFELLRVLRSPAGMFAFMYDEPVINGKRQRYGIHSGQATLVGNFTYFTLLNRTHNASYSVLAIRNPVRRGTPYLVRYGVRLHIAGAALDDDPDEPYRDLDHPVALETAVRHLGVTASEAVSQTILDPTAALEMIRKSKTAKDPEHEAELALKDTVGGYLDPDQPERPIRESGHGSLQSIRKRIASEPLRAR